MGFFEGFLGGFTETGSEMLQKQDEEKRLRDMLVLKSDEQIRVNRQQIEDEAKAEQERIKQQNAAFDAMEERQRAALALEPVLQMDSSDRDIITGETEAPSAFSGISRTAISPAEVPVEYFRTYTGDPDWEQKGMRDYRADMRTQNAIASTEERFVRSQEAQNKRLERGYEEAKKKEIRDEWTKFTSDKDSPYVQAQNISGNSEITLKSLDSAEKANNKLNIPEFSYRRIPGGIISTEAKALQLQQVEGALLKVQQTVGAISNAEMQLFGDASISPNNDKYTNSDLIARARAITLRQSQYFDFMNSARKSGMSKTDAVTSWKSYVDSNPILKVTDSGRIELTKPIGMLKKDKTWGKYIGQTPPANTSTVDFTETATSSSNQIPSPTFKFEDFITSLGQ